MLLRLLPCAVTPPPHRPPTITPLAYVMANPARRQPARAVARHPSQPSAVSRQPSAVFVSSLQPPASSLQPPASPLTRATRSHRQALRTVQPTSHPSGDNQAITDRAAFAPWPIQREMQPQNQPAAILKVINTYVDNLLITC